MIFRSGSFVIITNVLSMFADTHANILSQGLHGRKMLAAQRSATVAFFFHPNHSDGLTIR